MVEGSGTWQVLEMRKNAGRRRTNMFFPAKGEMPK